MDLSKLKVMYEPDFIVGKTIQGTKNIEGFGEVRGRIFDDNDKWTFRVYDLLGNAIFIQPVNKNDNVTIKECLTAIKKEYGISF